jgi:putative Mg2+ transporter-C (MgtC) family protein
MLREALQLSGEAAVVQIMVRLGLAMLLGGCLGGVQGRRWQAGRDRMHMLVALGAACGVLLPAQADLPLAALSHVLHGVIVGVGVVAGATLLLARVPAQRQRLPQAASLWMAGAVGMAAGLGRAGSAILATLLSGLLLALLTETAASGEPEDSGHEA